MNEWGTDVVNKPNRNSQVQGFSSSPQHPCVSLRIYHAFTPLASKQLRGTTEKYKTNRPAKIAAPIKERKIQRERFRDFVS